MGKKRTRSVHAKKSNNPECEKNVQHAQSLLDDVREARDVEFAAEKKNSERTKRRKIVDKQQFVHTKERKPSQRRRGDAVQRLDPYNEGLKVWRKAALKRKESQTDAEGDTQAIETALDVSNLNRSGIDLRTSTKIFETAKEQRAEVQKENLRSDGRREMTSVAIDVDLDGVGEDTSGRIQSLSDSDDDSNDDDQKSMANTACDADSLVQDREHGFDFLDASKITEEEELALSMFSTGTKSANLHQNTGLGNETKSKPMEQPGQRIMLADIILAKIREKETADAQAAAEAADPAKAEREKKIAEVYGLVGNIMSKYRSGKVPKALKVIPKQRNWEDLVYLTRPDEWSPAAVYVATRLLASNLPPKQVVRYYSDILLPRCLEDITENKKLNYHLYKALGKAVYKPEAFCKGILFPLCEDPSCTLRQATIIGSVVAKVSIPMLHSAAALLYICQLPYSPPNSIIITALIEKKYALPYRVLDAVVECFLCMKTDPRPLPLMWHQSLLSFAQLYKTELSMEQKESLKLLMRVQTHHAVTPEIRRELFSSRSRGDFMDPDANTIARNVLSAAAAH